MNFFLNKTNLSLILKISLCSKFIFNNKKKYLVLIFLLSIFTNFSAQVEKDIDSLFTETKNELYPVESLKKGFELLRKSKEIDDTDKIKYALFKIGDSYYKLGEYSKATHYCNLVGTEPGSDKYFAKLYALRVKTFLFLDFGMSDKAVAENKKAFLLASQIKNKNTDDYHKLMGFLWRDKSVFYTDEDSIMKYDKKTLQSFLKLKKRDKGSSNLSMPYNNVGYDYLLKGKLDSALYNYKKAEYYAKESKDEFNFAFVCQSYGEYYEAVNKLDSALIYYTKSLRIANKYKEYKLAKAATDYIRKVYLKKGDKENSIKYDALFSSLNDSIEVIKKRELNEVITIIEKEKDAELKKSNTKKYWIMGMLVLIALIISTYAVYQYRKNKKNYIKFTKVIQEMENKSSSENKVKETEVDKHLSTNISDVKEHELMKKLNTFERKQQFLSPEISLSSMASSFNTNVNYLSKLIKKYRDHNFNSYINELRINYITKKLRSNPEYLNYKITYLAEECGFTSYSSFVSIFKQQTGITPSKFIEYLSKEEIKTNLDSSIHNN